MLYSFKRRSALVHGLQSNLLYSLNVLSPPRRWLNQLAIRHPTQTPWIYPMMPAQCPFEPGIRIGNHIHINIPSRCQLNPLYEEVVG